MLAALLVNHMLETMKPFHLLLIVASLLGGICYIQWQPLLHPKVTERIQVRSGVDILEKLGEFESGNNDSAVGRAGEISRFQITRSVWRATTVMPLSDARNPMLSRIVADRIMQLRLIAFGKKYHVRPDAFNFYLLWNAPAVAMRQKPMTRAVSERAVRFSNSCEP